MTAIINGNIIFEDRVEKGTVLFEDGKIIAASADTTVPEHAHVIDAEGLYVSPGFVDIHCHGSGEHWFFDHPSEAAKAHLKFGTTSMLASLWRNAGAYSYVKAVENVNRAMEEPGSNIVGIHMEGPYLDPDYGCEGGNAWPCRKEEYEEIMRTGGSHIKTWCFDPMQDGTWEFAEKCHENGIRLSVCYSKAKPELLEKLLPLGLSIGNHILCGSGEPETMFVGTREPGSDVFNLVRDEITTEVIADSLGGHVRPYWLKLIYKVKGADRIALVSDCCAGGDTKGSDVNVINGELYGSRLTLSVAVKNMLHHTGAPLYEVIRMASLTPARAIGIDSNAGSIAPGKDADLVLLDETLSVKGVFKGGMHIKQ